MEKCKCYIDHESGDVEKIVQCPLCKAAPDLLEVCEDVAGICLGEGMNEVTLAKAKAAIAKTK